MSRRRHGIRARSAAHSVACVAGLERLRLLSFRLPLSEAKVSCVVTQVYRGHGEGPQAPGVQSVWEELRE